MSPRARLVLTLCLTAVAVALMLRSLLAVRWARDDVFIRVTDSFESARCDVSVKPGLRVSRSPDPEERPICAGLAPPGVADWLVLGTWAAAVGFLLLGAGLAVTRQMSPSWLPVALCAGLSGFSALVAVLVWMAVNPIGLALLAHASLSMILGIVGVVVAIVAAHGLGEVLSSQEVTTLEQLVGAGDRSSAERAYDRISRSRRVRARFTTAGLLLFVIVFVGIQLVSAALAGAMLIAVPTAKLAMPGWLKPVVLGVLLASLAVVGGVIGSIGRYQLNTREVLAARRARRLGPDETVSLRRLVEGVAIAMHLPRYLELALWLDPRSNGVAPSISTESDTVHLVISPQFIVLAARAPATVRAMIAHEFAHVRQDDAALWPLSMAIVQTVNRLVLPYMMLAFGLNVGMRALGGDLFGALSASGFGLFQIAALQAVIAGVVRARLRSEVLADLAAMLYADPGGLRDAVARLEHLRGVDHWHEPPDLRLARIDRVISWENHQRNV